MCVCVFTLLMDVSPNQLERNIRTRLSVLLRFVQNQRVITGKVTAVTV